MGSPSAPSIPKPPQVQGPPPIELSAAFPFFSRAQQHAFATTNRLLEGLEGFIDIGMPELEDQFAFQGTQRNFLSPIGRGELLGGEFGTLGAPFFSDETGSALLANLNEDTRDNLVQQGLFDSGTQAELENQNALFLASDAEQIRRQELQFLSQLFTGFQPAVTPDITGAFGAGAQLAGLQSSIGTSFLAPILQSQQLVSGNLGGNADRTARRDIAQAGLDAQGGGFGGLFGGLAGNALFGGDGGLGSGILNGGLGRSVSNFVTDPFKKSNQFNATPAFLAPNIFG